MIQLDQFVRLVCAAIPNFQAAAPDSQQTGCILHDSSIPLMIVAGPGSGKTTVLVLRALRLVFVDGLIPEQIMLTTFTNKAADELRSRLIEWGLLLKDYLTSRPPQPALPAFQTWLDEIDINRFLTGTLDSICEEALRTNRHPAEPAPVLVEGFVGNGILMRRALFPNQLHNDPQLQQYLASFTLDGTPPQNFGQITTICRTIFDRFVYDIVDLASFQAVGNHQQPRQRLVATVNSYRQFMSQGNRLDFALLEEMFLDRLRRGRLQRFTEGLRALLIDEYQDTNPLQEAIYFALIDQTNVSLTIVGDDDQSLYRFRGATVELFRDIHQRFVTCLPLQRPPQSVYLLNNYRSSPEIVNFVNEFVRYDAAFQQARVQPPKPRIVAQKRSNGAPVLGLFRDDVDTLADDLTEFLMDVFRGNGRPIVTGGQQITIIREQGGDFGDSVLLAHTVNEYAFRFGNNPPRERLPKLLRDRLHHRGIGVFNPRGRSLRDIPVVQRLLGLILECIDPGAQQEAALRLRMEAQRYFADWRNEARTFIAANPQPNQPHSLNDFVIAWQHRAPQAIPNWPSEWPLLELSFKLLSWLPSLQDDPEGQVYLEAVSRGIAQAATFSSYRSSILYGQQPHDVNSVRNAIRDILEPIAESSIDVDEEIMPYVPTSYFPIMTIHQAKGLEFPLVIVDVASDYRTNNARNRFRRFPDSASATQNMEDELASHCQIGPLRCARPALDRSFDDLIRLYYVAYSRPESVLLLVGVNQCLRYGTTIRHVATGWQRNGSWAWRVGVNGRPPALTNSIPLTLI